MQYSSYSQSSIFHRLIHSARLLTKVPCHCRSGIDALRGLSHNFDAIACTAEQVHTVSIPWVMKLLHDIQKFALAVMVVINQARLLGLAGRHGRCCHSLHCFLRGCGFNDFSLTLVLTNGCSRWGRGSTGIAFGWSWIIVHTPHVITEVPVAGKSIPGGAALAALICTEVRFVAMSVHSMCFTLMTEEAGSGRETGVLACNHLATVWFEMGVHKFTGSER